MEIDESTVSVLLPVTIDDTTLTSTNVAETDYAAWDSGTTYDVGDRAISTTTHRVYESAKASNLNHDPTDITNTTGSTIWWVDVDATNAWKMFDGEKSSPTVVATPLTVVLEPGFVNALCAFGLVAENYSVTMKDAPGGTVVYSSSGSLEDSLPGDYYEYFFSPFQQQSDLILNDLPPYSTCEITFSLSSTSGNVECGMLQVGDLRPLGKTQYGADALPKTYSRITIDEFGYNQIVRRKFSKDISLQAIVEIGDADAVIDVLTEVLDVPTVWVGTTVDGYAGLRGFGLGSGKMTYDNAGHNILKIDVKGLI